MEYQAGKSFTAQPDAFGIRAQVNVVKGVLPVKSIQDVGSKGTMAKVIFDISAMGNRLLKQDPYGNVSKDSKAYAACVAALESGEAISFRTETMRKEGVASNLPLSALSAASDTKRCLVEAAGNTTSEQITNPVEDATWLRVDDSQRPDFLDTNPAPAAGSDFSEEKAREVFARLIAAEQAGKDLKASDVFGAIAMVFGINVYETANR